MKRFVGMGARTAVAAAALAVSLGAAAQGSFPAKPVRMVIGFPAGSSTDALGRILANKMGELAGQQFVVENRPGAGSNLGAMAVAQAAPDGYTILLGGVTNAVNVTLTKPQGFDPGRDIVPLALVANTPNILVVNPSTNVGSVRDFIALAKAKPGELQYGSAGNGTSPHLSGELFNLQAGVKLAHIPYKGSNQAVTDLLGGRITAMFAPASVALPLVQSGKLKALAATTAKRSAMVPDLPTVAESGVPGYDTSIWYCLMATRGTPQAAIDRIASLALEALRAPEVKSQLAAQGMEPMPAGPAEFTPFFNAEVAKWAKVIHTANIQTD